MIPEIIPTSGDGVLEDGTTYNYNVNDRERGLIDYRENSDSWQHDINYDTDVPGTFKQTVESLALIKATLGHKITDDQRPDYLTAWRYVHTPGNAFLTYCARLIFDYHALDRELVQAVLLGMTRARYSMPSSALLHYDCTGASGAGKNDLVNRIKALIPSSYVFAYNTVSPTALQYATIERTKDDKGRVVSVKSNKDKFRGKVIIISEVADAAGFSALKALAETDEDAEFTHMATVNGEAVDMTITGPRSVITTSVEGVNDPQVKRRFIHGSVSEDTLENKETKLRLIETLLNERKDIEDDPRLKIARAGIDLIFSTEGLVFEDTDAEAWELIKELNALFLAAGYGITSIKQFFTLCECLALWKRFERGYTRIEPEDVQEAWFLLATFERETITRTSRQGIEVLTAIKNLCDEYDAKYEDDNDDEDKKFETATWRPTRREVVKASDVPQAQVYRLLRNRQDDTGRLGELIELGYVRDVISDEHEQRAVAVELTNLGVTVLGDVPKFAFVNADEYEPKEPIMPDDITDLEATLVNLEDILAKLDEQTKSA
jgi:hypothetical protein